MGHAGAKPRVVQQNVGRRQQARDGAVVIKEVDKALAPALGHVDDLELVAPLDAGREGAVAAALSLRVGQVWRLGKADIGPLSTSVAADREPGSYVLIGKAAPPYGTCRGSEDIDLGLPGHLGLGRRGIPSFRRGWRREKAERGKEK